MIAVVVRAFRRSIREFGPSVTSIILAGVAGTAITADLGARKIREELDALQVLGVDPVKNLVVPRFLALMLVTGLFDIYALLFGIFGGILATLVNGAPLGPFWATFFTNASTTDLWGSVLKTTLFGAIIAIVCCYKGMTASGGAEGVGELGQFAARMFRDVLGLRVLRFFAEALRQAGILILSSTLVIWGLVFISGLQCGIEGAYFTRAQGAPAYSGVFAAWCDLREIVPYAFGYMMAAKVGTGIVAEL